MSSNRAANNFAPTNPVHGGFCPSRDPYGFPTLRVGPIPVPWGQGDDASKVDKSASTICFLLPVPFGKRTLGPTNLHESHQGHLEKRGAGVPNIRVFEARKKEENYFRFSNPTPPRTDTAEPSKQAALRACGCARPRRRGAVPQAGPKRGVSRRSARLTHALPLRRESSGFLARAHGSKIVGQHHAGRARFVQSRKGCARARMDPYSWGPAGDAVPRQERRLPLHALSIRGDPTRARARSSAAILWTRVCVQTGPAPRPGARVCSPPPCSLRPAPGAPGRCVFLCAVPQRSPTSRGM